MVPDPIGTPRSWGLELRKRGLAAGVREMGLREVRFGGDKTKGVLKEGYLFSW